MKEKLRETLAANAHETWTRWTDHFLRQCHENDDGSLTIPADAVSRWRRQMATPYEKLTVREQASDQAEADLILGILETHSRILEDNG